MQDEEERKKKEQDQLDQERAEMKANFAKNKQKLEDMLKFKKPVHNPEPGEVFLAPGNEEETNAVINFYNKQFCKNDKYENGYKKPERDQNGRISLTFPTPEQAASFFMEAAKKNMPFIVVDAKGNVKAYSNGDGKLRQADGTEYAAGEILKTSEFTPETLPAFATHAKSPG